MSRPSKPSPPRAHPLVNPLEDLLGYQLRRASQAMLEDLVSALDVFDLRPTSVSVLLLVASNPGITQSRIGQILAVERANMVPMTAKLTKQGFITRLATDGRSHGLHLTAEGKSATAKIRKLLDQHEAKFWRNARVSERESIMTFLKSFW